MVLYVAVGVFMVLYVVIAKFVYDVQFGEKNNKGVSMAELIIYGCASAFAVLLGYLVHHMRVTRQIIERAHIEEREDMRKLNALFLVYNQESLNVTSTMCKGCSVGTARPPNQYCSTCREMFPKLSRVKSNAVGGPTTPTGVRS
jgi:hypothetical protein